MARSHDEFFKQKGTEHDAMIADIITDIGLQWVALSLFPDYRENYNEPIGYIRCNKLGINVVEDKGLCIKGCYHDSENKFNDNPCRFDSSGKRQHVSHYNYDTKETIGMEDIDAGRRINNFPLPYINSDFSFHNEVICSRKDFIIGYADLMITETRHYAEIFNIITKDGTKLQLKRRQTYRCLIEAKPQLTDVGAVLRQIKTYREILKERYDFDAYAIITKSDVPDNIRKLTENEGVQVLDFKELKVILDFNDMPKDIPEV